MSKQLESLFDALADADPWKMLHEQQNSVLLVTVAVTASLPLLVYYCLLAPKNQKPYPPGPPGLPIIGNLHQLPAPKSGEPIDAKFLEWSKEYGLVYTIKLLGLGTWIIIADPDLVQKIYVTKNFEKSPIYKYFKAVLGSMSLLFIKKEKWTSKRKAFAPGFSPKFLKNMVDVMTEKLERFVSCIDKDIDAKAATNMLQRTQTFTSDVIVAVAFGEDWGGSADSQHPARVWNCEIARLIDETFTDPFRALRFTTNRQIRKYEKLIDDEMMRILERRLADHTPGEKTDICSIAVEEMMREGGTLSYEDKVSISHQLKTFYFAGHDTTATTISWSIWLLSQKPETLAKVRAELKEHCIWTEAGIAPTYDDLQKCVYLEAVIKETLRLYPPASGVSRCTENPDEEWNGHCLAGANLVLATYAMGRHPLLWKNPDEFRPERFLDGSEDPPNSKYSISAKFTAFAKGPRDCIGKYFALMEAKLAISALVTRYDFDCVDPKECMVVLVTSLPANGAAVKFRRRDSVGN